VRIFSLQKVVEVAGFNMENRPRMVWAKIWATLSPYFKAVGTSSSPRVAMFAVDSLKQLGLKFLEKPELKSFSFQKLFLNPLLAIMDAAEGGNKAFPGGGGGALAPKDRALIRELVLRVCDNIIKARTANVRSGWCSFLSVYKSAARDGDENFVAQAFSMAHAFGDWQIGQKPGSMSFIPARVSP
jgi:Sec7-like guanine-nucleotide exchange factor